MIEEINAGGANKIFSYDANGNLKSERDEDGFNTAYTYDENNNLKSLQYADGKSVVYVYNKRGELVEFTDWNGTTSLQVDALGRLKEVNDHNNRTTSYEYDGVGNKTAMTYTTPTATRFSMGITRRINGNEIFQNRPNGEKTESVYDTLNHRIRATEFVNGNLRRINEYEYDNLGNVTKEINRNNAYEPLNQTKSYEYDKVNRLVQSTENKNVTQYAYDTAGNLSREILNGAETRYTYNNLNQLVARNTPKDSFVYQYECAQQRV